MVFWAGWPFFQRGWRSLVNRHLNMFTLIAMGSGRSLRVQRRGDAIPEASSRSSFGRHGKVDIYFEASAVIVVPGPARSSARTQGAQTHRQRHSRTARPGPAHRPRSAERRGKRSATRLGQSSATNCACDPATKCRWMGKCSKAGASVDESMITGEPIPAEKRRRRQSHRRHGEYAPGVSL